MMMLALVEYVEFKKLLIFVIGFTPLKSQIIQKAENEMINKPVIISNGKPIPLDTYVFRQFYYIIIFIIYSIKKRHPKVPSSDLITTLIYIIIDCGS